MKFKAIVILLTLFSGLIKSQPGKDGTYTVTGTKILNKYAPLANNLTAGSNTVVIPSALNFPLCKGDLIMVYQAQGASISTGNTIGYGDITSYGSAGLYEFGYVQSVSGNVITTQTSFTNSYAVSGYAQLIKVPQYSTLTINPSSSVLPKDWKDTTISGIGYRFGGLIVLHASAIINNGIVNSSGNGFRGGSLYNNLSYVFNQTGYVSTLTTVGGVKGEGIAGNEVQYDLLGGRYSRGAPANGGGGGNSTNAPGGGGANGSNGSTWTGQGVMIVDNANPLQAWSLDPAYVANGNMLTNSSGGGRGGYSWSDANQNALVTGPGNSAWAGDSRGQVGGLGGHPLTNINAESRIYFGGGGGSGQQNNNATGAAGDGGGIIYIVASNISGTGVIIANGSGAANNTGCNCDAPSGAGAGGSIVIKSGTVSASQTIYANGGSGGSQAQPTTGNPGEAEGPGGGGGGGFVAVSATGVLAAVDGGMNGVTNASALSEFPYNGATKGAPGQTGTVTTNFVSYISSPGTSTAACEGKSVLLTYSVSLLNYIWAGPGGFNSNASSATVQNLSSQSTGVYTLTGTDFQACSFSSTVSVSLFNNPTITVANATICQGGTAVLILSGASNFTLGNSPTSFTSLSAPNNTASCPVSPTVATIYTVQGINSNGCSATNTVSVNVLNYLTISSQGQTICQGATASVPINGASSYSWNGSPTTSFVQVATGDTSYMQLTPLVTTIYTVQAFNGPCSTSITVLVQVQICTGLNELTEVQEIRVYPNPANDKISISSSGNIRLYIRNELGQEIRTLELSDRNKYTEVANLPSGIYFLVDESKTINKKLVILK